MSTLIIAEHDQQTLSPATRHVIGAAQKLNAPITILIAGFNCKKVAHEASTIAGVQAVLVADNECYAHSIAENLSQLIVAQAASFTHILVAASTFGKNVLPRVAAMLDVTQVSDVMDILALDTFTHPIYAGNAIETVRVLDEKKVLTVRVTAFVAEFETQVACPITLLEEAFVASTQFIQHQLSTSVRPELSHAKIIVAGGRALQNAENFKLIEELADQLGAAVGASRAAVDAGFIANDFQVGQTGKIVAPNLYFAIGISGAVQHVAGMKESKIIVAINKDAEAPIFQIATYGLVGDLFDIIPKLIELLKK